MAMLWWRLPADSQASTSLSLSDGFIYILICILICNLICILICILIYILILVAVAC